MTKPAPKGVWRNMKIVNLMISKTWGGIEQAFLDYNRALLENGFEVLAVTDIRGQAGEKLGCHKNLEQYKIRFSQLNYFLAYLLYRKFKSYRPDLIIVHNKKAIPLVRKAARLLNIKVAGVAHNPKPKRLSQCDAIISITEYQKQLFAAQGIASEKIFVVPNMIEEHLPYRSPLPYKKSPVIGTMGRFDPMKGFPNLIEALNILKKEEIAFRAVIGGDDDGSYPEEKARIMQETKRFALEDDILFPGWIKDKNKFFEMIDIFVLPSVSEPFGIVLLEAMMHSKPIVSSDAEGPAEIFADTGAALLYPKETPAQLAEQLKKILTNPSLAEDLAQNGYKLVNARYTASQVGAKLRNAVFSIVSGGKKA